MLIKTIAISGLMALAGSVFMKSTGVAEIQLGNNLNKVQMETMGKQIRVARQIRKMSQNDLSKALQISIAQLESIESGRKKPIKEVVFKAENILKTTFVCDESYKANTP